LQIQKYRSINTPQSAARRISALERNHRMQLRNTPEKIPRKTTLDIPPTIAQHRPQDR
jgi:hypothetical protein